MQALIFLINTAFSLYLMVVLLRIWLQWARADFYNPLSQFVVKATNPVVIPLRRLLPSIGKIDTASVLLALVLVIAQSVCLRYLAFGQVFLPNLLVMALPMLVREALTLFFWVLIIRAIMSWFSQGNNPIEYLMHQLTEPVLRPVRRIIPPIAGLDLSVLVVIIALNVLNILTLGWLPQF
ncbi:MAG: YggT family protein [Gammaproteobacteria bacterium]|nr:YggT family protein [Gammaproteobacteria bacterium]MBU1555358.1 YggT family protein [Gammaproteobacteria bacterium]MBU2069860.1 YggT family protein [Gammaproteobacteria bacterium]MBU2184858.1 YggT family protein [Gammaproteobacteria bacterium]MBU2204394.1 YggT family protein [Gammaproteobacteria bacterium]